MVRQGVHAAARIICTYYRYLNSELVTCTRPRLVGRWPLTGQFESGGDPGRDLDKYIEKIGY
jgi:hypothetical protein